MIVWRDRLKHRPSVSIVASNLSLVRLNADACMMRSERAREEAWISLVTTTDVWLAVNRLGMLEELWGSWCHRTVDGHWSVSV